MGSTTYEDYRKHFAKDPTLSRRFQAVFIDEPSKQETLEILKGLKKSFESFHKVEISNEVLELCVEQSLKHILDRKFPDKALDLLDETCAHVSIWQSNKSLKEEDIFESLARVYKVKLHKDQKDEKAAVLDLKDQLKNKIFGQEQAIEEVYNSMILAYSGLGPKNKPLGAFLFTGPTGVGKTELSRQLAQHLQIPFIKFDMSEYMEKHSVARLIGAPPGYVGHEDGGRLTDEVSKSPHSVVLLDEIEKAHPDVINVLLQVMDSGELTDSIGKRTHFTQCILIMTSNSGAREAEKGSIGIYEAPSHDFSDQALKSFFSPEFLNRLTSIVKFNSLKENELKSVIEKELLELKLELQKQDLLITWNSDLVNWVLQEGFEKGMGARPFERFVSKKIRLPLAQKVISQKISTSNVDLSVKNHKLHLCETK